MQGSKLVPQVPEKHKSLIQEPLLRHPAVGRRRLGKTPVVLAAGSMRRSYPRTRDFHPISSRPCRAYHRPAAECRFAVACGDELGVALATSKSMSISEGVDFALAVLFSLAAACAGVAAVVASFRYHASVAKIVMAAASGGAGGGGIAGVLLMLLVDGGSPDALVGVPIGLVAGSLLGIPVGVILGTPLGLIVHVWRSNRPLEDSGDAANTA